MPRPDKESYLNDDTLEERHIRADETIKREKVENTPFTIVQTQDKTFIALGMYQVSGNLSYKECKKVIEEREWSLIMNVARLIAMDEIKVDQETRAAEREQRKKAALNGQRNYK